MKPAPKLTSWRGSLRLRLLLGTLSWILLSIGATAWGLSSLFNQQVSRQFEAELGNHLNQLAALIALDDGGRPVLSAPLSDPRLNRPYSGLYWQVDLAHAQGNPADASAGTKMSTQLSTKMLTQMSPPFEAATLRSRSLWDAVLQVPQDLPADGELHSHRIEGPNGETLRLLERVLRPAEAPDSDPKLLLRLIVAADEAWVTEPIADFNALLLIALGVLASGLVSAAILQVRSGLAPLNRLGAALTEVRDGRKSAIDGQFPSEIQPLVDEFNGVLARNAEIVARARTQAGNLAHAVKTPLTVLANAAAVSSLASPHTDPPPLAQLVIEQVALARTQVDHHLARARAAAALGVAGVPGQHTALRPVLEGLIRVMHKVHMDRALQIELQACDAALAFHGEEQDLQEMVGNLLDNACKWARSRVEVRAGIGVNPARLVIEVKDDGPGISTADRQAVLARGVRADERQPGSGLGLAIVHDLAQLYGGALVLGSVADPEQSGLRAQLTLPATAIEAKSSPKSPISP